MTSPRDRRAIACFLALAFGSTCAIWAVAWLVASYIGAGPIVTTIIIALGMWCPGLAALLVIRHCTHSGWRSTGLARLGPLRYYLLAYSLPAVGTLFSLGLTVLLGAGRLDPEFTKLRDMMASSGAVPPDPLWVIVAAQVAGALTIGPLIDAVFALGEELGWRGFLLPQLMRAGWRPWPAVLATGVVWGLWHAPVIASGHNYPDHPYLGILFMTVFCTLLGAVFGWLCLASGSVWPPTIAHGALNAIAGLPWLLLGDFDTAVGGMITSVIGWVPLLLFIAWLAWSGRLARMDSPAH